MGDGRVTKHAVIINGDTEARHLANVERAIKVLRRGGYKIHVASPRRPKGIVSSYVQPNLTNVQGMIAGIRSDDDDEVVYYQTGHGQNHREVCLKDGCVRDKVIKKIDALKFGRRTVIFDSCYGGNLAGRFVDDPRTLFISAGAKGQQVCCNNFAPVFWNGASALKGTWDLNGDGKISWQERFAAAYAGYGNETRLFALSKGYRDFDVETGTKAKPSFSAASTLVSTKAQLKKQLKKLKAGQYAVVLFSRPGCIGCIEYEPKFAAAARKAGGIHLFVTAKSNSGGLGAAYGVNSVPTVLIIDSFGNTYKADKQRLLASVASAGQSTPAKPQPVYVSGVTERRTSVSVEYKGIRRIERRTEVIIHPSGEMEARTSVIVSIDLKRAALKALELRNAFYSIYSPKIWGPRKPRMQEYLKIATVLSPKDAARELKGLRLAFGDYAYSLIRRSAIFLKHLKRTAKRRGLSRLPLTMYSPEMVREQKKRFQEKVTALVKAHVILSKKLKPADYNREVDTMYKWIAHADPCVREVAARVLATMSPRLTKTGLRLVARKLMTRFREGDKGVRLATIDSFTTLAPKLARNELVLAKKIIEGYLLKDPDGDIRAAARKALAAIITTKRL